VAVRLSSFCRWLPGGAKSLASTFAQPSLSCRLFSNFLTEPLDKNMAEAFTLAHTQRGFIQSVRLVPLLLVSAVTPESLTCTAIRFNKSLSDPR
jgi:hypothetical protein